MSQNKDFIGSGIIFPFEINSSGRVPTVTGLELVRASIIQILSWPKGKKFFNEDFGGRHFELLEEPSDLITKTLARTFVIDSIKKYETRVDLVEAKVINYSNNQTKIDILVTYRLKSTKAVDSFVYPFYKELIY